MLSRKVGLVLAVLVVGLTGIFLMGLRPTDSMQSTQEMPLATFETFEMWVSTLTPTLISVSGYAGYNHVKIRNTDTNHTIFIGNYDVITDSATTNADTRRVGYTVGTITSTYHTVEINTSLPIYAIGSANDASSSTINVMLGNW